ncbi:MAG TPA: hypothetical protein ENG45_00305, partial [Candidatus Aenigmarchaeota archaeon]|nr:hypothetical protein [Candidatus Aenigmarchaeota archaeon]
QNYKDVSDAELAYFASGKIKIDGVARNLELRIYALPEGSCEFNYGIVQTDELGNRFLLQSYKTASNEIEWWINCRIKNKAKIYSFKELEPLTLFNYTGSREFLKETELIKISDEIKEVSNRVVRGCDTKLEACLKLGEWVKNEMKYNTSYVGKMRDSLTIMKNSMGVCADYSHLLISFLRSLNIPSRYVAGYAYSEESLRFGSETFQPHAWVEAYVNGKWLPFDPTVGEFAYLDALHIKLFHSTDGSKPLVKVKYEGNAHVEIENPFVEIRILSMKLREKEFNMTAKFSRSVVSDDDYTLLIVNVTNLKDEYRTTTLFLTKPKDLELIYGWSSSAIILAPHSTKSVYFIFHTPKLRIGYLYTFPIRLTLLGGNDVKINLKGDSKVERGKPLEELLFSVKQSEIKTKYGIEIKRVDVPKVVYTNSPIINISIKNVGNDIIENLILRVKYNGMLTTSAVNHLFIGEEKNLSFILKGLKEFGKINVKIEIIYKGKTDYVNKSFVYAEKPKVDIRYEGPASIKNFEPLIFNLTVNLSKNVKYALLTISTPKYRAMIPKLKLVNFILDWKKLKVGKNAIEMEVKVKDEYNTLFSFKKEVIVERKASNPIFAVLMRIFDIF